MDPPAPAPAPHAAQPGIPEQNARISHQRMLFELADIARRIEDNRWLAAGPLADARAALEELPPEASAGTRHDVLVDIGMHASRAGEGDAAVRAYAEALELARSEDTPEARAAATRALYFLAVASLRNAETRNCVALHSAESCLFPIDGGGVHAEQADSRAAIGYLEEYLALRPDALGARWLLNLAYMTIGGYPHEVPAAHLISPSAFASEQEFPRFTDVAPRLGLNDHTHAGGVVVDDLDGDGLLDLLVSTWHPAGQLRLHRNQGDGTFTDRTEEAGLTGLLGGLNLVQADFDDDGDVDVLVLRGAWLDEKGEHPNSLLRNDGNGVFTDVALAAGLDSRRPTQCAAWADYDKDGDLDLYVGNEQTPTTANPCELFRNDGNGTFTEVAAGAGVQNGRFTKGVSWGDVDEDGFPDLYVSNMRGDNRLYRNRGDGTFEDIAARAGVREPHQSFATWFFDYDNDGHLDLFVVAYESDWRSSSLGSVVAGYLGKDERCASPRLYRGDGRGGFLDVSESVGLTRPTLPMGANFGDVDGDGWLDVYLGTGDILLETIVPNLMYRNDEGRRFVDVTTAGGFGHLQKGHGIAFADLDHDGDQDVFAEMGGAYRVDSFGNALFLNPGFGHRWLTVRAVGTASNRSAIGARIRVDIVEPEGRERTVYRHVNSGGSFGSNPLRQTIGLGHATAIDALEIHWPATGKTERFTDVPLDQAVEIVEGRGGLRPLRLPPIRLD